MGEAIRPDYAPQSGRRRSGTVLLFLLCFLLAASVFLWVRGYYCRDDLTLAGNGRSLFIESVRGGLQIGFERLGTLDPSNSGYYRMDPADPAPSSLHFGFGFVSASIPVWDSSHQKPGVMALTVLAMPWWFIVLAFVAFPAWRLYVAVRDSRRVRRAQA